MKKLMSERMRIYGAQVIAITALTASALLVACGGGGGSTVTPITPIVPPPVVVIPLPTLTLQVVTPASGTVNVATTYTENFVFSYTNATSFTADFKPTCNGVPVTAYTIGVPVINTTASTATISVTASGMPNNTTCTIAATKVQQVAGYARKHQHPLQCVMEET